MTVLMIGSCETITKRARKLASLAAACVLFGTFAAASVHAREPDWQAAAENYEKITRPISIDRTTVRFEDFVEFLELATGASLEPIWFDRDRLGLDPDIEITVEADQRAALTILEQVLARVGENFDELTWQFDRFGNIQLGPKSELTRSKYLVIYDVRDLLYVVPNFTNAPTLDLRSGGNGGGGGGNLISDAGEDPEGSFGFIEDNADEIVDMITNLIEPLQWEQSGGDASIREFRGVLLISAPEYMHRQIDGYWFYSAQGLSDHALAWLDSRERAQPVALAINAEERQAESESAQTHESEAGADGR